MKVLVVIVTYNGEKWIERCLNNVYDSSKPVNVIVIDNNSYDNTIKILKKFNRINLIKLEENLGFGAANNIGLSYAYTKEFEYVFLLNQDAFIQQDTLEKLIEIAKKNSGYGIISPIHMNGDATLLDRNFSNYMSYDKNPFFYSDFINNKTKPIYDIPFVNAAAWLLPRKTLETIGGFDPIFFHYGEDDNYCQRVNYHGFKIGVVSEAFIYHDRENRKSIKTPPFSKKYFEKYERGLKVKYANLNINFDLINNEKITLYKQIAKAFITLNRKSLKGNYHKLQILKKTVDELNKSRKQNRIKANNYL